jgi:ubiquitin carboxyl-terminal hydrolase 7
LIHRGTLGAGHYFAFIRPSSSPEESWFEFNDAEVTPMLKSSALSIGAGGFDSAFDVKDGVIFEKAKSNYTNAYMLVYIRDQDREEIMREVPIDEIPQHLKLRFDEENYIN